MGLRLDPVGGGQFKQAIKQIMDAESQPVKALERRKGIEEARMKLFQEFKGKFTTLDKALSEISGFDKLREFKVDMGDGSSFASITIDKEKAQPGSYQLEIHELARKTSAISNGFENPDEAFLGIGFITMKLNNGETAEVFVDENNSSLRAVANLINSNSEAHIRAAVIRDDGEERNPWKLILTSKKDGTQNSVDFPEFYFMDGNKDFYIDHQRDAKNALIKMDGFEVEKSTNDISDFLPGVNLHLKQARPDTPFTITITEDIQKIGGKVKTLIDQLNGVLSFIYKQNAVDEKSETENTFAGDTSLQAIEYRLRNLLHEGYPTINPELGDPPLFFLNQAGIEFDRNGTITFKEDKFNKTLETHYDAMVEAISGRYGFASQLKEVLTGYTRMGEGMLAIREKGLKDKIKNIDRQIEDKNKRLEQRQRSLTEQFARLEASLGSLQRQQQYVSATLPGGGGGIVGQLLG